MSASQDLRLALFLKFGLDVLYGLLAGGSILLLLFIIVSPGLQGQGIPLTASIPVAIGAGAEPQFRVEIEGAQGAAIRAAFVNEAQGKLRLETTNWRLVATSYLAQLLTAVGLAYIFYLLRAVLQAILDGDPFGLESVRRVRRLGYVMLLIGFLRPLVEAIAASEILKRLTILIPEVTQPSPFRVEIILLSLLILVLAQVWSYGLELEREQALTI